MLRSICITIYSFYFTPHPHPQDLYITSHCLRDFREQTSPGLKHSWRHLLVQEGGQVMRNDTNTQAIPVLFLPLIPHFSCCIPDVPQGDRAGPPGPTNNTQNTHNSSGRSYCECALRKRPLCLHINAELQSFKLTFVNFTQSI